MFTNIMILLYSCEIKEVQLCKGGWETKEEQGGEKACIDGCAPEDGNSLVWLFFSRAKQAEQVALRNEVS